MSLASIVQLRDQRPLVPPKVVPLSSSPLVSSRPVLVRLAGVIGESVVDGPGIRQVLFLQGCEHNCPGCHNPQTHALDGGKLQLISEVVADIAKKPWLTGVTFSGGEPFLQPQACLEIMRQLHEIPQLAHFNYLAYTGFLYERLQKMGECNADIKQFLANLDILIDGPFVLAKRDLNLAFRGSSNQRIIYLKQNDKR